MKTVIDNESKTEVVPPQKDNSKTLRTKRIIAIVSVIIAAALMLFLAWYFSRSFFGGKDLSFKERADEFRVLIESYGNVGVLVAFGIQALQVIVSPIPGEVIEIGMGLCFGWFWGTVICLLGVALGGAVIFAFTRKYGVKIVELFVSTEKINQLRFINNAKKLERLVFLLYLIPGTPKDPLIFFFGLTKIRMTDFLIISTLARIPSVITSTIFGSLISDGKYLVAIIIFAVTAAVSLAGVLLYNKVLAKMKDKNKDNEQSEVGD